MREITWILDPATGELVVEGLSEGEVPALAGDLLPPAQEIGCARPRTILLPPAATEQELAGSICVRVAGYYHNSIVEGPGRRSCVLLQFCPLQCRGCWVPNLHSPDGGVLVPAECMAEALLDPSYQRDGISILGGEPTAQPDGLLALVRALRARGCPHILCYTGYTYETLCRRGRREPAINDVLDDIDVLIDGPFVEALVQGAGPWTGSANQRVIDLVATRRTGRLVLLSEHSPRHGRVRHPRSDVEAASPEQRAVEEGSPVGLDTRAVRLW